MNLEVPETNPEADSPQSNPSEHTSQKLKEEEIVFETPFEKFAKNYLEVKENNIYVKTLYHLLSLMTFVTIGFNTPVQISIYPYLDICCICIYTLNFLLFTFDAIMTIKARGLTSEENSFFKNPWKFAQFIISIFLLAAAVFQTLELLGFTFYPYIICSLTRIPLSINFILLIPDYVNIDLGEVFTNEALTQLGVQLIGGINGICLRTGTDETNFNEQSFTIPFLHCSLYEPGFGYRCPTGFECVDQNKFNISDGNLYFQDVFQGIMFVYQGSIQDGWSGQYIYSIQGQGIIRATVYYLSLILFSAWLVRNVFVAVITQVLSGALEYDPPVKEYNLRSANFGLTLTIEQDRLLLKDVSSNKKLEGLFNIILKYILKSIYWSILISVLLIVDTILLAFVGMITIWQIFLGCFFILEPFLKLFAFGKNFMPIEEWIFGEFLFPIANITAVILNIYGFYQLDIIYALRLIRIISVHGFIWGYIKRILGNYVRFGSALVLAIVFLFILATLSLQIFVGIPTLADQTIAVLQEYPDSFLDTFIIFLQGGAFSTLLGLSTTVSYALSFFVILYFIGIHFLSNTIMMSIFITFILANLELTEEEIKEMQKEITIKFEPLDEYAGSNVESQVVKLSDKLSEGTVLPLRFKIFKYFKNSAPGAKVPQEFKNSGFPNVNLNFMQNYLSNNYPTLDERFYIPDKITSESNDNQQYIITKNFGFTEEDFKELILKLDYESLMEMLNILKTKESPLFSPLPNSKGVQKTKFKMQSSEGDENSNEEKEILILQRKISEFVELRNRLIYSLREQHPFIDRTLFIFKTKNIFRRICGILLNSRYINKSENFAFGEILGSQTYFEWVMIIITLASTILMMLETAENMVFDQSYTTIFEYVFISISVFEFLLRLISQGLIFSPSAIFNDPSGVLNLILLIFGIIHLFYFLQVSPQNKFLYLNSYTTFAIFLRLTRCLRPFRIVLISTDLFRVIVLLVGAWKNIAKVLCLLIILLLFFTYFGYLSFKDRLYRCNDDTITDLKDCNDYFDATLSSVPLTINNENYNSTPLTIRVPRYVANNSKFIFDDFGNAYLSSYIMMTLDGWDSGMDYVKASVGSWVTIYFYAYVFFANLIGVSMFVGVVCQGYSINTGVALLTKDQRNWSDLTQRIDLTSPVFIPQRPLNSFRAFLYDIILSFPYRIFHTLIICISPTALLIYGINIPEYPYQKYICYLIILGTHAYFLFDMFLKIISFGFITFFKGIIIKIDTILIILTFIIAYLKAFTSYTTIDVFNYILISTITLELILLSTRWDALYSLMLTFITSVIKSLTTITVMFIIMVVYALLGNVLYGRVKFGLTLNRYFNFRTAFNGLFILFILATGDNWSAYMFDMAITEPMCTYDDSYPVMTDCGGKAGSLIIQQMILNLFIANVLSNFAVFCASDEVNGRFKPSDIAYYLVLWNKYDRKQNSYISRNYARMFCLEYFNSKNYTYVEDTFILAQLLEEIDHHIKESYAIETNIPSDNDDFKINGKISFRDLMLILAKRLANIKASFKTNELINRMLFEEEIAETVASGLISKWYKFIKSYDKRDKTNLDINNKTIRVATERVTEEREESDNEPVISTMKFDPDSLKKELEKINEQTQYVDVDAIEAICNSWHDEYLSIISARKLI